MLVFHADVNSAFLSWSALKKLKEEPGSVDLRTIPSAIGGDVKKRHGVITAKSLPAKKYGVRTGEPVVSALRKCPGLVLVPPDFGWYRQCSHAFIEILKTYSPFVQQVSIDEAYLDMTGMGKDYPPEKYGMPFPLCAAYQLKDEVKKKLGFTINVGISTNKLLAKMASDFEKPDKVHTLYPEEIEKKMWPLPIEELHGCGRASAQRLRSIGIRTIGEAAGTDESLLQDLLGEKNGHYLYESANGRSADKVNPVREKAKSYSNERTTPEDITAQNYKELMPPLLKQLSTQVAERLQKDEIYAHTIFIQVKTSSFRRHSRQATLPSATNDPGRIYQKAIFLMHTLAFEDGLLYQEDGIRLVGVGASGLEEAPAEQMDLFHWAKENESYHKEKEKEKARSKKLEDMEKQIRTRFGPGAIYKADEKKG